MDYTDPFGVGRIMGGGRSNAFRARVVVSRQPVAGLRRMALRCGVDPVGCLAAALRHCAAHQGDRLAAALPHCGIATAAHQGDRHAESSRGRHPLGLAGQDRIRCRSRAHGYVGPLQSCECPASDSAQQEASSPQHPGLARRPACHGLVTCWRRFGFDLPKGEEVEITWSLLSPLPPPSYCSLPDQRVDPCSLPRRHGRAGCFITAAFGCSAAGHEAKWLLPDVLCS